MSDTATAAPDDARAHQAAWAVSAALIALPFLLLLPIDYDRIAPLALVPAILLGWRCWLKVRSDRIDTVLLTLTITAALLSTGLGPHPAPSTVSLASWAWILAAAGVVRGCATAGRASRTILFGIAAGASLGCLAVWLTWSLRSSSGVFPFYGHSRIFGLHMMVGVTSSLALLLGSAQTRAERLVTTTMAAVTFGGLFWSGGRAPIAGVATGLVILLWRGPSRDRMAILRWASIAGIAGLGLSLLQWTPEKHMGWWTAVERTAAATSLNELSSTRLDFWKITWQAIFDRPWLGQGADAYRFLTPKLDGVQPHNWILQLLLDFGLVGGTAAGAWLLRQIAIGLSTQPRQSSADNLQLGAAAALAACTVTGLLDGVFYHAVILVPTALLAGLAGGQRQPDLQDKALATTVASPTARVKVGLSAVLAAAALVLGLHSYLVFQLRYATPPRTPNVLSARVLKRFPSTTIGLDRWLERWKQQDDLTALEWARWAQPRSAGPAPLYVFAAVICADHDDFAAADHEMEMALKTAHWLSRPALEHMRASIKDAASGPKP
jgi:O-antigen ligase